MSKIPCLVFPGKFKVYCQTLPKAEYERLAPPNSAAFWASDIGGRGGCIYLDESRSEKKKKEDLKHELQHALVDWLEAWFTP